MVGCSTHSSMLSPLLTSVKPLCRCRVTGEEQRKDRSQLIDSNRLLRKSSRHSRRLQPGPLATRSAQLLSPVAGSSSGGFSFASAGAPRDVIEAASSAPSPLLTLHLPSQSFASPRSLPDEQQQQLEENEDAAERSEPACCGLTLGGTPEALTAAVAVAVIAPPSSFRHSAYTTPLPEDALIKRSMDMTCDVSWNVLSNQKPATAFLDDTACGAEVIAMLQQQPPSSQSSLQTQQSSQPLAPRAASLASFCRRRLSSQTCDALQHLTRLYRSKVIISRRSSLRRAVAINIAEVTSRPEWRDAERENRLQHFADRLSDLLRCYALFARELPDVARLPLLAQMALIKSCAPTFLLVCAAELFDKGRAGWVDERGDVVPAAVIDDLVAELRRKPTVEDPMAAARCRRRFFRVLSSVEHRIPIRDPSGSADRTAIALVQVIILYSPELLPPGIVKQDALDALANAQQLYVCLLRQYLEATYSFVEAAELWPKLLCALETCKRSAHCLSDLLLSCDAVRGDALLEEILQMPPA